MLPNGPGGLKAIESWHLHIHQYQVKRLRFEGFDRVATSPCSVNLNGVTNQIENHLTQTAGISDEMLQGRRRPAVHFSITGNVQSGFHRFAVSRNKQPDLAGPGRIFGPLLLYWFCKALKSRG